MRVTAKTWRRSTAAYRGLVAAQTTALAVVALRKVMSEQPRASAPGPIGIALSMGALLGLAGGLLAYYRRSAGSSERGAIIVTWACLQSAGLCALVGYAVTGEAICFIAALVMLMAMHVFSPNRFRNGLKREP
jgi:hypothetical protein